MSPGFMFRDGVSNMISSVVWFFSWMIVLD